MFINKNISVISSDVKRYNVIPATLSFSYLNKEHTIVDCVLDTGCSSSLISANSLNFEQTEYSGPKWTTVRSKSTAIK